MRLRPDLLSDQELVSEIKKLRERVSALEAAQPRLKENLKNSKHTMEKALEAFCLNENASPAVLRACFDVYYADKGLLKENEKALKGARASRQALSDILANRVNAERSGFVLER